MVALVKGSMIITTPGQKCHTTKARVLNEGKPEDKYDVQCLHSVCVHQIHAKTFSNPLSRGGVPLSGGGIHFSVLLYSFLVHNSQQHSVVLHLPGCNSSMEEPPLSTLMDTCCSVRGPGGLPREKS